MKNEVFADSKSIAEFGYQKLIKPNSFFFYEIFWPKLSFYGIKVTDNNNYYYAELSFLGCETVKMLSNWRVDEF